MAKRMVGTKIDNLVFNHWKSNKGVKWPLIGMCNMALGRSLQSLQFFLCNFLNQSLHVKDMSSKFLRFIISQNYEFGNLRKFSHFNAILITNHIIYHKKRKWWLFPSPSHSESCKCVLFITSCSCMNYLIFWFVQIDFIFNPHLWNHLSLVLPFPIFPLEDF